MDKARAEYLRAVEARFVALRGRGFMLSPRDVGLVDRWREAGIPARVVLAAVEEGARRFRDTHPRGVPMPSTLAYFANHVESVIASRRELLLGHRAAADEGARDAPLSREPLLEAIEKAGRAQTTDGARDVLRDAWRTVRAAPPEGDVWALTADVDRSIVDGLLACLPEDAADELQRSVEAAVEAAGGDAMSPRGRADARRHELERRLRERFEVTDLVEVLLGSNL